MDNPRRRPAFSPRTPGSQVRESKDEVRILLRKVNDEDPEVEKQAEVNEEEEARLASELEIQSLKLELGSTRRRLRTLEAESGHSDIFLDYEREIEGLRRICASLRLRNVKIEQRIASGHNDTTSNSKHAKIARSLETKVASLEKENADLRHSLRNYPLTERIAKAKTMLASQRGTHIRKLQSELNSQRQQNDQQQNAIAQAKLAVEAANAHIAQLTLEYVLHFFYFSKTDHLRRRDKLDDKVAALRDYIHSLPLLTGAAAHLLRDD